MGKAKKKNLSELTQRKRIRSNNKGQTNPFEVHINRDKQKVLGQKCKNDRGLPGVSRAKAINKRKRSLLQEYKVKNKDNLFLDKRIGEKNIHMTADDRAMARFAAERIKTHQKKQNIFSLNDDEVLTHKGQTLEEIERFDDPKSDDEFSDDENATGKLNKNFVQEAHFGGGVLSKPNSTLSRKDLIDQLIAESKKRKVEKQKIREQTIDLTEKLDSEWRDLLPLMSNLKKSDADDTSTKVDDYDIAVQKLKFEATGNPSEKLKSEEEIVQEEKERLEALEADRLARMRGLTTSTVNEYRHRSADDLDDGYMVETIAEDINDNNDDNASVNDTNDDSGEHDNTDNDDEEINNDDITDDIHEKDKLKEGVITLENIKIDEHDNKNQERICLNTSNNKHESVENDENLDNKGSDDSEESEDDLSDLKLSESSSEDENEDAKKKVTFANDFVQNAGQTNQEKQVCQKSILKQTQNTAYSQSLCNKDKEQEIKNDLLRRKEIMEKAKKELPYTYNIPGSFEELEKLLDEHSTEYQSIIIDRIIKCNHWSLDGKNKEKLSNLFIYLLQYINNYASADSVDDLIKCFQIFDRLCPYLYDLAHMNADNAKTCIQEIIKEKHNEFEKMKKGYPEMDTLIFFKLVSLLFPTSDFRHPVVTPCLTFMSQILFRSRIKKRKDIAKGLFISTLILEYTILSKRFAPSVINFLCGLIYIATPEALRQKMKIIPPFKTTCNLLVINEKQIGININPNEAHMITRDLIDEELDDEFRVKALITAVNLITEFKNQLQELEAVYSIFEPILKLLKIHKFKQYPSNVRKHIKILRKELENLQYKKLEHIVAEKKRPKPLRLYEPKIMTVYDGKQHKAMSKEKAEREKLLHKYKKEMKGAIREIRRDRAFLANVQISQQIKSDIERKRKVKEIFGEAAMQQSEFKKMKRKK